MSNIEQRLKAKGPGAEAALVALADLVRKLKRRERWRNSKRTQRSRFRAHRSWVTKTGVRQDGHAIRPVRW